MSLSACDRPRRRLTGATALVHASHLLPLLQDDGRAVVEGAVVAVLEQTAHEGNPLFVVDALDRAEHLLARETLLPARSSPDLRTRHVADQQVAVDFLRVAADLARGAQNAVVALLRHGTLHEDLGMRARGGRNVVPVTIDPLPLLPLAAFAIEEVVEGLLSELGEQRRELLHVVGVDRRFEERCLGDGENDSAHEGFHDWAHQGYELLFTWGANSQVATSEDAGARGTWRSLLKA